MAQINDDSATGGKSAQIISPFRRVLSQVWQVNETYITSIWRTPSHIYVHFVPFFFRWLVKKNWPHFGAIDSWQSTKLAVVQDCRSFVSLEFSIFWQVVATTIKNFLLFDLGLVFLLPTIVIPALTGLPNDHNRDEFLTITAVQASWLGEFSILIFLYSYHTRSMLHFKFIDLNYYHIFQRSTLFKNNDQIFEKEKIYLI